MKLIKIFFISCILLGAYNQLFSSNIDEPTMEPFSFPRHVIPVWVYGLEEKISEAINKLNELLKESDLRKIEEPINSLNEILTIVKTRLNDAISLASKGDIAFLDELKKSKSFKDKLIELLKIMESFEDKWKEKIQLYKGHKGSAETLRNSFGKFMENRQKLAIIRYH